MCCRPAETGSIGYLYHGQLLTDPDYQREIQAHNISDTKFRAVLKAVYPKETLNAKGIPIRTGAYECVGCAYWKTKKDAEQRGDGSRTKMQCGTCDGALTLRGQHEYKFMLRKVTTHLEEENED